MIRRLALPFFALLLSASLSFAQPPQASDNRDATIASLQAEVRRLQTQQMHQGHQIRKDIDDVPLSFNNFRD